MAGSVSVEEPSDLLKKLHYLLWKPDLSEDDLPTLEETAKILSRSGKSVPPGGRVLLSRGQTFVIRFTAIGQLRLDQAA